MNNPNHHGHSQHYTNHPLPNTSIHSTSFTKTPVPNFKGTDFFNQKDLKKNAQGRKKTQGRILMVPKTHSKPTTNKNNLGKKFHIWGFSEAFGLEILRRRHKEVGEGHIKKSRCSEWQKWPFFWFLGRDSPCRYRIFGWDLGETEARFMIRKSKRADLEIFGIFRELLIFSTTIDSRNLKIFRF